MKELTAPSVMDKHLENRFVPRYVARTCQSSKRTVVVTGPVAALTILIFAAIALSVPGPLVNQLNAGTQSELLEFEYRPVGTVPAWTEENPLPDSTSPRLVVASDYRHYEREANDELWSNAIAAVARKLDEKIAIGAGSLVPVDRQLIKTRLLVPGRTHTQVYQTPLSVSIEPASEEPDDKTNFLDWHRCFMELDLNDEFYEWASVEYERRIVESRVWQTALVVLSGFSLLVVLFGFLKFNHRTQGVYTGRLQSLAIFAAIAVIIIALALSNSIVWL